MYIVVGNMHLNDASFTHDCQDFSATLTRKCFPALLYPCSAMDCVSQVAHATQPHWDTIFKILSKDRVIYSFSFHPFISKQQ